MALTASADFNTTINGLEMAVAAALSITLPGGSYTDFTPVLSSVSLSTQMTTDLPDGIRDESGYSTTGGSIVLAGAIDPRDESATVADFFNPNNSASPLYRLKVKGSLVTFDFGVVPEGKPQELLRKFTGRITSFALDQAAGTVTLQVGDLGNDWTDLPDLPAVITEPPYNAGLTSEFVLDFLTRNLSDGQISTWPAQRPDCVLAVGMRSSVWPEIGSVDITAISPVPVFAPGPYGTGLANVAIGSSTPGIYFTFGTPIPGNAMFVEYFATIPLITGGVEVSLYDNTTGSNPVQIVLLTNGAEISVFNSAVGFLPATVALGVPHYVSAKVTLPPPGGTTWSAVLTVDGTSGTVSGTCTARSSNPMQYAQTIPVQGVIAGLQVTTETAPVSNGGFVPQAFIDPSKNPLQVAPPVTAGTQGWDLIQTLTSAELGYSRRDETGRFWFTNRDNILNQPVTRTVTSEVSLETLQTEVGAFTEYGAIDIDYTDWNFGAQANVFTLATPSWRVSANGTPETWTQNLATSAAEVAGPVLPLPADHNPLDGGNWYRSSIDKAGTSTHRDSALTVFVTQPTPDTIAITATDKGANDAWFVSSADFTDLPAGTPALWIGGIPVTAADATTVTVTYDATQGTFPVPSNGYRQDRDTVLDLGAYLLADLHTARPDYTNIAIVPDARIQVPDKILLTDKVSKVNDEALIWGSALDLDFTPGSPRWDMTIDCRALAPPGAWKLGQVGASEMGSTTCLV